MNVQVNQNERLIRPSDPAIRYTGRIDNSNQTGDIKHDLNAE